MTSSWFSVSINMQGGGEVFSGFFRVDNCTNIITDFY